MIICVQTPHYEPRRSEIPCSFSTFQSDKNENSYYLIFGKVLIIRKYIMNLFSDNSWKWLEKVGFFKNYEESIFPLIVFEISVMEKFFPSQIFQKVWVEKLILHSFWKIQLFLVILSWIIYENELKTIKYISLTKSIRRENLRQVFSL